MEDLKTLSQSGFQEVLQYPYSRLQKCKLSRRGNYERSVAYMIVLFSVYQKVILETLWSYTVLVQQAENTKETVEYGVNNSIVAHHVTDKCGIISMNLPSGQVN